MFNLLQAATEPGNPYGSIVMILVFLGAFYFISIYPQQKKQKQQKSFASELKTGDTVVTFSGVIGKISELQEHFVVLEVDRAVKIKFTRASISKEQTEAFVALNAKKPVKEETVTA